MALVREFHSKYPPSHVGIPAEGIDALGSNRIQLFAPKPLVRMTSATEVVDDKIPPLLLFRHVEFLHKQLAILQRRQEIGYLKYLCMAYDGALRRRRELTLKKEPLKREKEW